MAPPPPSLPRWLGVDQLSYEDKNITCVDCGKPFVFTAGEQAFFAEKGFGGGPKRCPNCRAARRAERDGAPGAPPRPVGAPGVPGTPPVAGVGGPPRPGGFAGPRPGGFGGPRPGGFAGPRPVGVGPVPGAAPLMRGRGGPRAILPVDEPYRINERIRVPEVRVIIEDDEGTEENLGVMPTFQARQLAAEKELDLVEVAPQAMPPVCKVMDYGRFKYNLERKQREQHRAGRAGKAASEVKDVQLSPRIDEHDLHTKVNRAFEFLDEGHPVRMVVRFLGRDMRHPENGQRALETALEALQKLIPIRVDQAPRMEGRQLFALIRVDKAAKQRADKVAATESNEDGDVAPDSDEHGGAPRPAVAEAVGSAPAVVPVAAETPSVAEPASA